MSKYSEEMKVWLHLAIARDRVEWARESEMIEELPDEDLRGRMKRLERELEMTASEVLALAERSREGSE